MFQIILLEDDPVDCELIETTLTNSGLRLQFARVSGRQNFLECLKSVNPQLILADYVLPGFDGLAALELAKTICPQVPFILVSGVVGEEQAIEAMKQGATDYVLKQRLQRLVPAVQRALQESLERQERQRVTMALKQTDDLLRTIVEESPVGIVTLNREQRVMTWNTAAEKLYGWPADACIDRPLQLIPKAQRASFDFCFRQALQNRTVSNHESQHLRQDGKLVDVSLSLAPLHDADERIYGVVMVAVDITINKQVATQRLNLLEQESAARTAAESANRIKDEFLAVLSHELRTPLNAIIGWIKLIKKGNLNPSVRHKAVDTIERNAIAQAQLIEDLLDLSRIIRGQVRLTIRPVDVSVLINLTVDTLRPAIEAKSIRVSVDCAPDIVPILADPSRLQQVLWNLLSNAIKFTPANGRVVIDLQVVESHLQIQVSDSGIGIAPDFLPHVFDYFRQADGSSTRSQGGLGLGLAITRRLIELHGGTIEVESPGVNQGTTFTVRLPVRTSPANTEISHSSTDDTTSLQNIRAVVIDDEADSRELLTVLLEQHGVQVESAASAQAALCLLEDFQPDIILSDIGMPTTDGYSFIQSVRSSPHAWLRKIPAVAVTAYAQEEDHQRALAAGYQSYIAKPFDLLEIVSTVHELTISAR